MKSTAQPQPQSIDQILKELEQFRLGDLPTEKPHPKTSALSQLAQEDPFRACELLREVEIDAVRGILDSTKSLVHMTEEIRATLDSGGRVFLCGCGATGRLSLSIETFWRERFQDRTEQVISFMAGGDFALIRSIESFEDFPEYGARQLRDLGFDANDLLISCTEGGETPFVIGATEEAIRISRRNPFFLYCNPDEVLAKTVERSKKVIENSRIHKINLHVGPMALSGSTRLQAATVLMLATGTSLFSAVDGQEVTARIFEFIEVLSSLNFEKFVALIELESEAYKNKNLLVHSCNDFAITLLTDTTERSPTFSLLPFNQTPDEPLPSWTYLMLDGIESSEAAWQAILKRQPRALDWPELNGKYGLSDLMQFDFSNSALQRRIDRWPELEHTEFRIQTKGHQIVMSMDQTSFEVEQPQDLLVQHLLVKVLLNIQSLLVMGRLGRFEGNLMVWVRSTNKKLMDRSIRYVVELLSRSGFNVSYEEAAAELTSTLKSIGADEPVVLRTVERLKSKLGK